MLKGLWVMVLAAMPLALGAHDFHLSLTEINLNPNRPILEISVRLFVDDLEKAILANSGKSTGLVQGTETKEAETLILAYYKQHFSIKVDGRALTLVFVGKELKNDALWCHFAVADVFPFKSLTVHNALLLDQFEDQTNMVNCTVKGQTESVLCRKGAEEKKLSFHLQN